jgi:hypothetical protein
MCEQNSNFFAQLMIVYPVNWVVMLLKKNARATAEHVNKSARATAEHVNKSERATSDHCIV